MELRRPDDLVGAVFRMRHDRCLVFNVGLATIHVSSVGAPFAKSLLQRSVVNRTATFVFYIGDRYFGVITAAVDGPVAQEYRFTSTLPIAVLKLLIPQLEQRLAGQFLDTR